MSKRAADKKRQAETAEPAEEKKPVDGALENAKAALKAGDAATARVALAARAPKPDDGYEVPYLAGRAELLDGNHEKALPLFERALTLDPSQSEVRYLLGECHWELGHVDQAKEAFDAVVRQRPDDSRARLSLAKIEFAQGNTTQALELTQAVVKDQEGLEKPSVSLLFEAHYLLSRIHAVQDNLEAQRRHLTEALDLRECHEEALLALSRYLSDRKQFEEAKKRLLKCSDKCESVAFYRDLALIHLELSELSEAASVVDKGLAAHEDDINLLLLSGRTRARLNEVETSKKAFERVIEKAERQQEAYLELSALLVDSGRSAEAVELLNSGVEKMTNPGPLLERLADVYSHLRDAEETRKTLARLVDIQPMNFKARLKLAEQLKASGFVKEAILHYEFLYKHDNLQRNVRRSYADALLEAGRFEEAERELTLLVQQDPNDLRAKTLLGAVLVEAGREDEAEKHLHEVVKKDVHDSRAQYYLARMMMNHERHKKALAYFGRSLAGKDPRLEYRFQYGKALLTIGGHKHYSEAVDAFSGIISRYEKGDATNRVLKRICDVYLNRGRAFMKLRLFKKALADFEKAMDLDRTRADTVTAFASSLLRQSRYREAERFLLEVIEEDPTYPDAHFHLGELYVQREQFNDARRQFHLVIKESELSFPTAYRHLGYIYRTKGMDRDALKYFKKYLSLAGEDAPDRRDIRRMLRLD